MNRRDRSRAPPGGAAGIYMIDQPFDVNALRVLRETVADHARAIGAPHLQLHNLLIVVAELTANAIRHGGGHGHICLWHDNTTIYCQVSDHGPGLTDPTVGTIRPRTEQVTGRGLWLVRQVTRDMTIDTHPDGHGTSITVAVHHTDEPTRP